MGYTKHMRWIQTDGGIFDEGNASMMVVSKLVIQLAPLLLVKTFSHRSSRLPKLYSHVLHTVDAK